MANCALSTSACIACGVNESALVAFTKQYVHRHIVADLSALSSAANAAGFDFAIASAYRSFWRQKAIWNNKFHGHRAVYDQAQQQVDLSTLSELEKVHAIMLFSALPGGSRHHFGSDLDVYARNLIPAGQRLQLEPWEYEAGGYLAEFNDWLNEHLADFGFYRPYDRYRGGVAAEPWHISHRAVADSLAPEQSIAAIATTLERSDVAGKETILQHLPALYESYIVNVAT